MRLAGPRLILAAESGSTRVHASLSASLEDGVNCSFSVPFDRHLRSRLSEYHAQVRAIEGEDVSRSSLRRASRATRLHLNALQALDAWKAGSSQRDIAVALFGEEAVLERWAADSELRAQLRHLLTRAKGFMNGGYLQLAGARRQGPRTEGDEPVR